MKYPQLTEQSSTDDVPTRQRVALSLLEDGPSTAAELAERLAITAAAVRRHLDQLLTDGAVDARAERIRGARGRGRPARVFVITAAGRDAFEQAYDDLAASAMRFLATTGGDDAVRAFAKHRVADLETRYRPIVEAVPEHERAAALAAALSGDGFAATARTAPSGEQICQHHCPVAHVAEEFPQLCEAETEVFARLLGSHVQRLATIAHGDGICTTNIPHGPAPTSTPSRATQPGTSSPERTTK